MVARKKESPIFFFLREPIFFMRHATEPPCDKSQSYLIGAGGVRGVWAVRADARESLAGRDMRAYGAGEAAEPPTAQQTTPKSRSGISSRITSRVRFVSLL